MFINTFAELQVLMGGLHQDLCQIKDTDPSAVVTRWENSGAAKSTK